MDELNDRYLEAEHQLYEREYTVDERKALAEKGFAMPDGSFPIQTIADLNHAIRLWGHSNNPAAARRHIIKRARALGATKELPYGWVKEAEDAAREEETHARTHESLDGASRISETVTAEPTVVGSPDRHILEVTLLCPGTSKNGNTYHTEALRSGVPLFEGARAFVDHPHPNDLPERSVRDLVGSYRNVRLDESGRLRGELHLVPGNVWLFSLLREAENNPALCGLSIDAWCDQDPRTRVVSSFRKVESVDIVTRPSAGGQVNRVLQSDRAPGNGAGAAPATGANHSPQESPTVPDQDPSQTQESQNQNPPANGNTSTDPSLDLAKLIEGIQADRARMEAELKKVASVLAPAASPTPDPNASLTALAEELRRQQEAMRHERDLANCQTLLALKLSEAALPAPVADKIRKRFSARTFEASELETLIAEEKDTLAALTSAGQITGLGYEKALAVGFSEYDQIQAAMDKLFDITESDQASRVPPFSGIREAFRVCTGVDISSTGGADRILTPAIQEALRHKVASGRLSESEVLLKEADVTTASFSYLLGTSMNKRLLKDYQAWPSEWQKFTTIVAIKDFKQQDRIRLGAFGSLSTVAEDAAYTTLSLADTRATYTATKRGNLVQVTRETIINDDLYAIKQIPQKLAVAAAFTLAEFVYNLLAPNFGNIYDSHPLFDSVNHANTGVLAANLNTANSGAGLSSSALQTAVIKMRKQQNMASKPIGLKPRFLLVPPDLEFTAMTILKSAGLPGGNNNDINPMMGYAEPIVSPQLNNLTAGPASTTVWIAVADPRVIDTLEVGFVGGQANPVLLIQDMPLYGLNFTQDTISYKVRHEYGGAVVDYRGFYLGNN